MLGTLRFPAGATFRSSPPVKIKKMSTNSRITICAAVAEPPPLDMRRKAAANLYEVLRVKRNASQMEIKTAYRSLAKIYHPDVAAVEAKHPEESLDGRDFIEIHNAYATLVDPAARAIYDLTLNMGCHHQQRRPLSNSGNYSAPGGYQSRTGFYTTRRWETDQCW